MRTRLTVLYGIFAFLFIFYCPMMHLFIGQKTRWYNLLRIGFERSEIRICVPKSILEAFSIKATVGSVDIYSIVCNGDIDIETNTGNIRFE